MPSPASCWWPDLCWLPGQCLAERWGISIPPASHGTSSRAKLAACWRSLWSGSGCHYYHDAIVSILEKHAPVKMSTIRSNIPKLWSSDVIHEARQPRRRCKRKWLKTRLEIHRELYVRQREQVVLLINSAKRDYTSEPPSPRERQVTRTTSSTVFWPTRPPGLCHPMTVNRSWLTALCSSSTARWLLYIRTALDDIQQLLHAGSDGGATPCGGAHSWQLLQCDIRWSAQAGPGFCKCVVHAGPCTHLPAEGVGSAGLCPTTHAACWQQVFGVVSGACLPQDDCNYPDLEETQSVCQQSRKLPLFSNLSFLDKVIEEVVAALLWFHLSAHGIHDPISQPADLGIARRRYCWRSIARWHQQRSGRRGRRGSLFSWAS